MDGWLTLVVAELKSKFVQHLLPHCELSHYLHRLVAGDNVLNSRPEMLGENDAHQYKNRDYSHHPYN